jgi:adenosine deaminase CECR1
MFFYSRLKTLLRGAIQRAVCYPLALPSSCSSSLTLLSRTTRSPRAAHSTLNQVLLLVLLAYGSTVQAQPGDIAIWFETFKKSASDKELYQFLYGMPKGGDLHNHMSGAVRTEWFLELALAEAARGYVYYTRVRINNCRSYGTNEFGNSPYLLLFLNLQESNWSKLPECERQEFRKLQELSAEQREGWLNSMRLDQSHEGRDEFFQTHWQRMADIYANPYLAADTLVRNMQAFGAEGLLYIEPQVDVQGYIRPDGSAFTPEEVADIHRARLLDKDALATGVQVKLQLSLLRFTPNAEAELKWLYQFAFDNRDLWVAVNMVGREDNDKGHPLRFLKTLRELRQQYHSVKLSIHAGEVDEPNFHIRDTLLLGADRIGHGVNLITDDDTMRLMRHGPYMVEINLISNLLLEYVSDYSQHPFPEYLRTDIPVALSTDDRGMWDSNMTDEFFVAVKEFNLSWPEIVKLSRNSLSYSFAPDTMKQQLLTTFDSNIAEFERAVLKDSRGFMSVPAVSYGFLCRRYALCVWD